MDILGVDLGLSTPNHPQTDGQTERMNRTLEDMLRCAVKFEMTNRDLELPLIEFAYNNSVNASTGMTPSQPLVWIRIGFILEGGECNQRIALVRFRNS